MRTILTLSLCLFLFATTPAAFAEHEGDIIIGRTSAAQLAAEFNTDEAYELPQVALIPGDGWGGVAPGFEALEADEPAEDFYMLSAAAQIAIELISIDADLMMWDNPPTQVVLQHPGDQWDFPTGNAFHKHGFWLIDDPDFSELGEAFMITFKLIDRGGTYADSNAYTAQFTPVPEPGMSALVLLARLTLRRLARA